MISWILYALQFVIMIGLIVAVVVIARRPKQATTLIASVPKPEGPAGLKTSRRLLTPPPMPINRTEFLQARIAYLAHMRDVGIEVEEVDESGNTKKHIRPAKPSEMIDLVNIRDADHVASLLETWDQVQKKQREES